MATNIRHQIRVLQSDGTDFSTANEAGATLRLRTSNSAGADTGAIGAFTEIITGMWWINIDIDTYDTEYFRVEWKTDATAPVWATVNGFAPYVIPLQKSLMLAGGTMTGNIVMGDNSVTGVDAITFTDVDGLIAGIANKNLVDKAAAETITGVWSHTGFIDITKDKLKIGGVAVTITAAEANKLDGFTGDKDDLNYAKDLKATGVTVNELDKLDGFTGVVADLNIIAGAAAAGLTAAELLYIKTLTSDIQTQVTALDTAMLTASQLVAELVDGSANSNEVMKTFAALAVGNARFGAQVAANRNTVYGTDAANTISPTFIGQTYVKTDTGNVYIAKGLTTADWVTVS